MQTSLCAFSILATATSGVVLSTPASRRARSVARRGSQRERNRLVAKAHVLESHVPESQVLSPPFEMNDALGIESLKRRLRPSARQARLDEPRPAGEWPGKVRTRRRPGSSAGSRGDLEPRLGGAGETIRLAIGAGQDQKRGDLAFSRGEKQAPRGRETIALETPDLADDRSR